MKCVTCFQDSKFCFCLGSDKSIRANPNHWLRPVKREERLGVMRRTDTEIKELRRRIEALEKKVKELCELHE